MTMLVTKTPAEWSGTIMELVLGFCSRSMVVGRFWYVFRRGRGLCRLPAHMARGGAMPGAAVDPAGLDQLVGARWSLLGQNCALTFNPYWRKAGAAMQNNADDRNAMARSIALAVLMMTLAIGGIAGGGYWFWVRPVLTSIDELSYEVDRLGRSQAAHFGDVKRLLRQAQDQQP